MEPWKWLPREGSVLTVLDLSHSFLSCRLEFHWLSPVNCQPLLLLVAPAGSPGEPCRAKKNAGQQFGFSTSSLRGLQREAENIQDDRNPRGSGPSLCPGGDIPMKPPRMSVMAASQRAQPSSQKCCVSCEWRSACRCLEYDRRFFSSLDTLSPFGFLLLLCHLPAQPHRCTSSAWKQVEGSWCQPHMENRDTTLSLDVSGGPAVFFHLFS